MTPSINRTPRHRRPGLRRLLTVLALTPALGACAEFSHVTVADGEAPLVMGPAVRNNTTPLEQSYACYQQRLANSGVRMGIGVGEILDYTGKYSDLEGSVVTQGGALMAYSALGKLRGPVRVHERSDTRVAELELAYMEARQLGDGTVHEVNGQAVPWVPYFGGSISQSDYYIVGGITEVNYNIQSGGIQAAFDLIGPRARTFTLSVAVDLRIVDTGSLEVAATSSLQKQMTGYEVGFEVFKFFDSTLVDINAGAQNQEPLQLGVRTAIELAVLELMSEVTGVPYEGCVEDYFLSPRIIPRFEAPREETPAAQTEVPPVAEIEVPVVATETAPQPVEPPVAAIPVPAAPAAGVGIRAAELPDTAGWAVPVRVRPQG